MRDSRFSMRGLLRWAVPCMAVGAGIALTVVAQAEADWPYFPPEFFSGDPVSASGFNAEFQRVGDHLNDADERIVAVQGRQDELVNALNELIESHNQLISAHNALSERVNGIEAVTDQLAEVPIASGSYTPTWSTVRGFSRTPSGLSAEYSRVGQLVTVTVYLGVPSYSPGTNEATLTVPPGLPVADGGAGSALGGVFTSDWYRNSDSSTVGVVTYESTSRVRLKTNDDRARGAASSHCTFVYRTSAE